ncbi:unnamed protein product (macronuclear) [Paramecium tetraurelia]|uniref:EF-hand domain-containing protein n=1 Tax=Paramecium tetraurelia TaxID=5888 RepID=A0EFF1_PARTE|nr:uncharacterized protein GSPATT00026365001 [Paramecium tetraurelia]CAK94042.1 unnamed protein product [Paramecium tetraurelia]|eukprot:XP_001461415.1 hypothetical protein (macronuclear) [Paramecium tetraurelia strain d4-2]
MISQKQLPNISRTPQAKSFHSIEHLFNSSQKQSKQFHDNSLKSLHNISNVSFIRNDKYEVKQDQYYASPLLSKSQMFEVERQSRQRKNEVYSQMLSENPFKFNNDSQEDIVPEYPRKVSSIHVNLFDLRDKEKLAQLLHETSEFSDKLSQHIPQTKPANVIIQRQDVIKLAQWIDYQMKIIVVDSNLKEEKLLFQLEQVFNQSLKELVREISIDCVEKGVLLEKIWNQYVKFNNIVMQANQQDKINQETEYLNQLKQVHQTYQISVQVYEDKVKLLEKQIQQQQQKYEEKIMDFDNLNSKYKHIISKFQDLKQENDELKNKYCITMNENEDLSIKNNALLTENQKIIKQLNDRINYSLSKQKRGQHGFGDFEDHKSTSCYDLYSTMEIHVNKLTQTNVDKIQQYVQTDYRYFKQVGIQCDNLDMDEQPISTPQTSVNRNNSNPPNSELRKAKEINYALEDRVRMEIQIQDQLRKQKQLIQREVESQQIKLTNQDNLIIQLQKDIQILQQQLEKQIENKQREMTVVSIEQQNTEQQMTLGPQQTTSSIKTSLKIETQNKTHENASDLNKLSQSQKSKQLINLEASKQSQSSQQLKQTNSTGLSKISTVETKDSKKQIKSFKNSSQIIPRRQSQNSLHVSNSQELDKNQVNEDPLSKLVNDFMIDTKTNFNQRGNIITKLYYDLIGQVIIEIIKIEKGKHLCLMSLQHLQQNPEQIENTISLQNLLKQISFFYKERLEQKYPLYAICYEYFMNQYGLKNVAEQKMTSFCQSLIFYQQNTRIRLFSRFLQLYEGISNEDLDFYIQSLSTLDEHSNPLNLLYCNQTNESIYVKQSKIKKQLMMLNEKGQEILEQLNQYHKIIKGEIYVDLDQYYQFCLEQFQYLRKIQKDNFNELFLAIDVDDNQIISIEEFEILFNLIEDNQNLLQYKKLFLKEMQNNDGLNFYQFGMFCMHYNLFTKQRQDIFFFSNQDSLNAIYNNWGNQRTIITSRLKQSNCFNQYYQNLIRKLDNALKNNLSFTWNLWKILEEQSKKVVLDNIILNIVGNNLNSITEKYEYLFSKD